MSENTGPGIENDNKVGKLERESQLSPISNTSDKSVVEVKLVDIDLTKDDSPVNRKRSRVCRAKHHKKPFDDSQKIETFEDNTNFAEEYSCDIPCMKVMNTPTSWSYTQIKDFIEAECGPVLKIEFLKDEQLNFKGSVALSFENCVKAKEKLENMKVEGKCLVVKTSDSADKSENTSSLILTGPPNKRSKSEDPWGNDLDIWKKDPNGLYGLNPRYLKKLGIIPPLVQWVNVANFRCSKSELKEVMDLAGNVVTCSASVMPMKNKVAKVMYSHPLEAVQAVSMLNGRIFFGEALKVTMCLIPPDTVLLPKGLVDIGPGMGADDKPLRDVVQHYERYISGHTSLLNTDLFNPDALHEDPNKAVDENISRAIDRIKHLMEEGVTLHHIIEALKRIREPKSVRKFKTMCVDELCDNEDNICENNKSNIKSNETSETNTSYTKKESISIIDDVESQSKIDDLSQKVTGRASSPCSSISSDHSTHIYTIFPRPRNSGSIERLVRPSHQNEPPKNHMPQPVTPSFPNNFPGPNVNRFPVAGPVAIGPHGSMIRPTSTSGPMHMVTGSFVPTSNLVTPINNPMPLALNTPGPAFNNMGPRAPMALNTPGTDVTTLEIRNLHQCTTIKYLCDRLAEFGQVLTVQFARPGCAIVQFADRMQATQCFQQLNNSYLLGNIIELRCL